MTYAKEARRTHGGMYRFWLAGWESLQDGSTAEPESDRARRAWYDGRKDRREAGNVTNWGALGVACK